MFTLDDNIEKATIEIGTIPLPSGGSALNSASGSASGGLNCRLMRDDRYFWVLIIPEIEGVSELHDLTDEDAALLAKLTRHLSQAIMVATSCDKINTAAIGNVVPMLHMHVVARHHGDEAWPQPVWGRGEAKPMSKTIEDWRVAVIKDALKQFKVAELNAEQTAQADQSGQRAAGSANTSSSGSLL